MQRTIEWPPLAFVPPPWPAAEALGFSEKKRGSGRLLQKNKRKTKTKTKLKSLGAWLPLTHLCELGNYIDTHYWDGKVHSSDR